MRRKLRDVGGQNGYSVMFANAYGRKFAGELACPAISFTVGIADITMYYGLMIRIDRCAAPQERQWAKRHVIRCILVQTLFVLIGHEVALPNHSVI